MLLFYTQYKYSKTATILDVLGSGFILMGVILGITGITEISGITSVANLAEVLGFFFAVAIFVAIGIGIKKYAKKLAKKKQAKAYAQMSTQSTEENIINANEKEENDGKNNGKLKKILIAVLIFGICYLGGTLLGNKNIENETDQNEALTEVIENDDESDPEKIEALSHIYSMMEEEKWTDLWEYFCGNTGYMQISGITYFQNGEVCETIESGMGMILSSTGVYLGEIENGQRVGEGCQFGTWGYGNENYCTIKGMWMNDEANGECIYTCYNENVGSDTYNFIYEGNITSNLFDGEILYTWENCETEEKDEAVFSAVDGHISYIRKTTEGYVYAESETGMYWYAYEEEGLDNNGIWCDYTH